MKTIALYGIATDDQIVVLNSDYHEGSHSPLYVKRRPGGIFNVQRAIQRYTNDFGTPLIYGAVDPVIINVWRNRKQSFPKLSFTPTLKPIKADWHHIAYLDELPQFWKTEILEQFEGTISIDLCGKSLYKEEAFRLARYINYWFMSEDHPLAKEAYQLSNFIRSGIIVHSSESAVFFHRSRVFQVNRAQSYADLIDVVGAGDYFAAGFICGKLYNNSDAEAFVVGHQVAYQMLGNQNGL